MITGDSILVSWCDGGSLCRFLRLPLARAPSSSGRSWATDRVGLVQKGPQGQAVYSRRMIMTTTALTIS